MGGGSQRDYNRRQECKVSKGFRGGRVACEGLRFSMDCLRRAWAGLALAAPGPSRRPLRPGTWDHQGAASRQSPTRPPPSQSAASCSRARRQQAGQIAEPGSTSTIRPADRWARACAAAAAASTISASRSSAAKLYAFGGFRRGPVHQGAADVGARIRSRRADAWRRLKPMKAARARGRGGRPQRQDPCHRAGRLRRPRALADARGLRFRRPAALERGGAAAASAPRPTSRSSPPRARCT